jgi:hypothetical protein
MCAEQHWCLEAMKSGRVSHRPDLLLADAKLFHWFLTVPHVVLIIATLPCRVIACAAFAPLLHSTYASCISAFTTEHSRRASELALRHPSCGRARPN